jgi:hypothetical protein
MKKGLRTVVQVVAAGGLTALVAAVADGLSPKTAALLIGAFTALVAFSQNYLEGAGKLPVLLPTPALIASPATGAVATVDAAADKAGTITGDVVDPQGAVVGEVTGQVTPDNDAA